MLTVVVLVCSMLATPDRADCAPSTAKAREVVGQVELPMQCLTAGEQQAAAMMRRWNIATEYAKVMCVRTDLLNRG